MWGEECRWQDRDRGTNGENLKEMLTLMLTGKHFFCFDIKHTVTSHIQPSEILRLHKMEKKNSTFRFCILSSWYAEFLYFYYLNLPKLLTVLMNMLSELLVSLQQLSIAKNHQPLKDKTSTDEYVGAKTVQVLLVPRLQTLSVLQHDGRPGVCMWLDSEIKLLIMAQIVFLYVPKKKHKTAICDSPYRWSTTDQPMLLSDTQPLKTKIGMGVSPAYIWLKGYSVCPFCWRSAVGACVCVPLCWWIMLESHYLRSPSSFWRYLHTDLWLSLQLPGWVIRSCLLHQACFNISE